MPNTVLYLVPTPIGNLEDITLRAIRILGEVGTVLCEDTRTSGRLMQHLGLKKPLLSYHLHNEHQQVPRLLERLAKGETIGHMAISMSLSVKTVSTYRTRVMEKMKLESFRYRSLIFYLKYF